jgi:hypothetical protein
MKIWARLKGLFVRKDLAAKLVGAPAQRRMKTYSAQSGYIYHYFYEGLRETDDLLEYCFEISGDRKTWFRTTVKLPRAGLEAWTGSYGRKLRLQEQYAIAKLALFEAFDTRIVPDEMRQPVCVPATGISQLLAKFEIEL